MTQRYAINAWEQLYRKYGGQVLNYPADQWVLVNLDVPGSPGNFLVDAGCGSGRHVVAVAQRGWKIIGIDSSRVVLSELAKHIPESLHSSVFLICADLHQQILARSTCNAGLCVDTLSVVDFPERVLNNLHVSACGGAIFLITIQSTRDETCGDGELIDRVPGESLKYLQGEIRCRFYTLQGVISLVEKCGWQLLHVEEFDRIDPPHSYRSCSHLHVFFGCVIKAVSRKRKQGLG